MKKTDFIKLLNMNPGATISFFNTNCGNGWAACSYVVICCMFDCFPDIDGLGSIRTAMPKNGIVLQNIKQGGVDYKNPERSKLIERINKSIEKYQRWAKELNRFNT